MKIKTFKFFAIALLTVISSIETYCQIPGSGVTDVEGYFYESVIIGNQEWMKSDLRTTRYSNGDSIVNGQSLNVWFNCAGTQTGAYCILNNDSVYANQRGKIYNGFVVYDSRNVCPTGWRIPTDADFAELEIFIGLPPNEINNEGTRGWDQQVGVKLKSPGIIQYGTGLWDLSGTNAGTDIYGWNGYPHAARIAGGDFYGDNGRVGYLCKNPTNDGVIRRELGFNVDGIIRYGEPMPNGHQIRCLKTATSTGYITGSNAQVIKLFPNPAGSTLTIDYGNFALMNGYQLRIENSLGQQVFQTNISQQSDTLNLGSWGGNGLYFVHIVDPQGNTVDIRKIVLQ